MQNNWTGERLETFINSRDTIEHLHRYAIASKYVKDKVVLDIACGEGYGSNLMSEVGSHVYAVDIDVSTIQTAKLKYKNKKNIEFIIGNANSIPIASNSIDVVVSFETIEHHNEHDAMLFEIKRVLKSNGILIISTPDKLYYSEKRKYNNEFHIKELYKQEFIDLISRYFSIVQLYTQTYLKGNSIIIEDKIENELQFFSGGYLKIEQSIIDPLFMVIIASDVLFESQKKSIFDGSNIINRHVENQIKYIYNSNSYRLGNLLLLPFKILKKIFK